MPDHANDVTSTKAGGAGLRLDRRRLRVAVLADAFQQLLRALSRPSNACRMAYLREKELLDAPL